MKLLRDALVDSDRQISIAEKGEEIFTPPTDDPVIMFAENLSSEGGKYFYCESEEQLFSDLKHLISYRKWTNISSFSKNLQSFLRAKGIETSLTDENSKVALSLCQGIVSKTGSIIITSTQGAGTHLTNFPQIMIIIAMTSQIYASYKQVLALLSETPPEWVLSIRSGKLISEEVKEFYLFLVED
ncbi:MAG: LUD domain-containing protein [Bacteroidales bacterium]|nr:LUD domain-containing protein [Bacteroidales bacterium]